MKKKYTIVDCYTDEPAGLGVPPYAGVYPRYIAGKLKDVDYLTIDDIRLWKNYKSNVPRTKLKTNIKILNLSRNYKRVSEILKNSKGLIIVMGAHTPGKYLSAVPGTISEVKGLLGSIRKKKYISGPVATEFGSSFIGGKMGRLAEDFEIFDLEEDYDKIKQYAIEGVKVFKQIFNPVIAEVETGHGCSRKIGCSFCTDPLKHDVEFREQSDIIKEVREIRKYTPYVRLGKQSCFFSYKYGDVEEIRKLLEPINKLGFEVLHIDNVNPAMVNEARTKLVVKYCSSGNVGAFGVESFDEEVIKKNNLNADPETTLNAVRIINKFGSKIGKTGLPKFLPGINLLYGLIGERKETFDINFDYLKRILDEGLMLRRINIRQVVPFRGTRLHKEAGLKYLKKNKKHYWSSRKRIRREIDLPMLKRLVPVGSILKNVRMEIYDGKTSFGRQFGSYPLIVGIKNRLELNKFYDVKIVDYMLRGLVGEVR